jgi:hypothetical protein
MKANKFHHRRPGHDKREWESSSNAVNGDMKANKFHQGRPGHDKREWEKVSQDDVSIYVENVHLNSQT